MSRNKKIIIGLVAIVLIASAGGYAWWTRRSTAPTVTVEAIRTRDLEAVVSASGKIQPKRFVNISADTSGRVVDLAVNEGDRVAIGQFLMQIDPRTLRTRVESGQAALQANQAGLDQARQGVETARVQVAVAQQTLKRQQELWKQQLTPREALERAENDVRLAQSTLSEREKQVRTQEVRLGQDRAQLASAQFDLSKVRIESPIAGIITRRNIQEGETAVVGTMNNAGTVLLTVADMSVIQAEVEVDETNIPNVKLGQAAKITIDAVPDRTFKGHVTEIGNSPIQVAGQAANNQQATNFKVVVVLDEEVPDIRPGFTCTAEITTATRTNVVAVPIPAVAVRELVYDAKGAIVKKTRASNSTPGQPSAPPAELEPGQTRKETEGVFVIRDGRSEFIPIKIGIAGDRYFEVLTGLKAADEVITGPYNNVRTMNEGDQVRVQPPPENAVNKFLDAAGIALSAIWGAKLRSLMTVLGNIVAVMSIIAVVSLIQGLNASVSRAILNEAGADSFIVQQYGIVRSDEEWLRVQSNPRITRLDAEAVKRYSPLVSAVMLSSQARARIIYRSASIDGIEVTGVTPEYVNFSNYDAERGRLISPTEIAVDRPAVVLGAGLAERLFGPDVDPIDKVIQIQGLHFRVVGVSARRGTALGQSLDEFAVVPLGQFQQMFGARRQLSMSVKPRDFDRITTAIDDTTLAMRIARRLKPSQPDNFAIFNSDTVLGLYRTATGGIFAVLVGVVALSLVVGGIVIMNIMLMVVTERTREIGLRKALGARRSDITTQILTESVVLSVFGGVVGTILGALIAIGISRLTPVPAAVQLWSVVLGITITALVGLFFGLYPAIRAARLDPIEALRRE